MFGFDLSVSLFLLFGFLQGCQLLLGKHATVLSHQRLERLEHAAW